MGRTPCCEKNGLKRGPWTTEEDQKLVDYIHKHGYGNWRTLPKNAGLQRCGKSCRLRWTNYLRPDIKRGKFSFEEEETIIHLHSILGNKWSAIASRLPGRTDNEIKNYWNTHIRKRLLRMGIDPVTHTPRLDLLDISSILNSSLYTHSSSSSSQMMNLSRLLGMQPLHNPELLKLDSSLNYPYIFQHDDQQMPQLVHASQFQANPVQDIPNCAALTAPCAQFSGDDQQLIMQPFMEQFSTDHNHHHNNNNNNNNINNNNTNFCEWQSNGMPSDSGQCYVPLQDYVYQVGPGQSFMDNHPAPSSETSTFQSNTSNNLSFQSILSNLSTPSSSPGPLNSNSAYVTSHIAEEDERDQNHCSNLLKFEIPDIFGC